MGAEAHWQITNGEYKLALPCDQGTICPFPWITVTFGKENKISHPTFRLILLPMAGLGLSVAHGQTEVSGGLIEADTVWSASGSPYTLTGEVLVAQGVTLSIDPGVTIEFDDHLVAVGGRLLAEGLPDDPILFGSNGTLRFGQLAAEGSLLHECQFSGIGLIGRDLFPEVDHCSFLNLTINKQLGDREVVIRHSDFTNVDMDITSGATLLEENELNNSFVYLAGTFSVRNNFFECLCDGGVQIEGTGPIVGNQFIQDHIRFAISEGPILQNSLDLRGERGDVLFSQGGVGAASLVQNDFHFQFLFPGRTGIRIITTTAAYRMSNNSFRPSGPLGPKDLLLDVSGGVGSVVDAENNWWGTTDEAEIEASIEHFPDGNASAFVDYIPFRTSPIPLCWADEDCTDDGVFCNGPELCLDGLCDSAGDPCLPDGFCNEDARTCGECRVDTDCDNDVFCDGMEAGAAGVCQLGVTGRL